MRTKLEASFECFSENNLSLTYAHLNNKVHRLDQKQKEKTKDRSEVN